MTNLNNYIANFDGIRSQWWQKDRLCLRPQQTYYITDTSCIGQCVSDCIDFNIFHRIILATNEITIELQLFFSNFNLYIADFHTSFGWPVLNA